MVVILSSPSGAGKTTLVKKLSNRNNFKISISHTTRNPRINEKNGKDYFFIKDREFKNLIQKRKFLEHAKIFKNYYGSLKETVIKNLEKGENVYLRSFGSFIIKKRAEKTGRNISKNIAVKIPAQNIPSFKPAKIFVKGVKSKVPVS